MSRAGLPQILIVEPHPDVARALRTILDYTLHVQTLHATHPGDLADLLSRNRPDLIVVDATSRGIDAREIVASLRAAPGTRHVPIVGIRVGATAAEAGESTPFDHLLPLPFRAGDVVAAVRRFLDVRPKIPIDHPPPRTPERRPDRQ